MTNKERIDIIDEMLMEYEKSSYDFMPLCSLYSCATISKSNTTNIKETFPAITFFVLLNRGDANRGIHFFWWKTKSMVSRLRVLRQLRSWYSIKLWLSQKDKNIFQIKK